MDKTYHAVMFGNVQGVGYRVTVKRHAETSGVRGIVRNLPDGTVEVYAQGSEEQLRNFFNKIQQQPGGGHVSRIDKEVVPSSKNYEGFSISS